MFLGRVIHLEEFSHGMMSILKKVWAKSIVSAHMSFDDSMNIVNWHAAGKVESEIDESGTNAFQLVKVLSSAQRTTL